MLNRAGVFRELVDETRQRRPDRIAGNTAGPGGPDGRQHVFHLEPDSAVFRQRDLAERRDTPFPRPFGPDDGVVLDENGPSARGPGARASSGCAASRAKKMTEPGQYGAIATVIGSAAFSTAEPVGPTFSTIVRLTAASCSAVSIPRQAEVVSFADVGDHCRVAHVEAQPFAQHAAAGRFEDGGIHLRIEEHGPGAFRSAAVAGVDPAVVEVNAVGAGHAHALARGPENVGDQAGRRRLAVRSRNGHDGNPPVLSVGEHRGDDGFADGAGLACRRLQVHSQSGGRIDFDDHPALLFERHADVAADDVDAGDVQTHDAGRIDGAGRQVGMHRSVTSVAVPPVLKLALRRRTATVPAGKTVSELCPCSASTARPMASSRSLLSDVAWFSPRRGSEFTCSTSCSIVCTPSPTTSGGSRRAAATTASPITSSRWSHPGANFSTMIDEPSCRRRLERGRHLFAGGQVDRHSAALIAVLGLDDDRQPDLASHGPGLLGVADGPSLRNGNSHRLQETLRQFLVLGDRFADGAGPVGLGSENAVLARSPPELHQAPFVQPPGRDAPGLGGPHDRARAGPQTHLLVEISELRTTAAGTSKGRS